MRPLIINLLTFLRTMNYEQEQKKTTKRVEKVDVDDDVVLEEKEYLFQPLRYLPQPLRRRGAQTACKLGILPDIATDIPANTGTKMACTPNIPPNIATKEPSNTGIQAACTLDILPYAATNEPSTTGAKAAYTLDTPRCIHGESRRCITFAMPTRLVSLPLGGSG